MNLTGRNFLKLLDYTPEEIRYLLDLSKDLKIKRKVVYLTNIYQIKTLYFYLKNFN